MNINSVSSPNMATSYQKISNNQDGQEQQQQRVQRRDGSGQGKQLNKAKNQTNVPTTTGNYSIDSSAKASAIGSSFDMSV